jgi:hypothetical protein
MRRMRRGCVQFKKAKAVSGYQDILDSFEFLKKKFKINNVKLYLDQNFSVVNAYAIGSFSGSTITLTMGLINQMQEKSNNHDEFIDSVRAIMAHEMSHLANKDFLPGLLTNASKAASNLITKIIRWVFVFLATVLKIIPWLGWPISKLIISVYNLVNFVVMAFFNFIFMPLYNFLIKFFGRSIEYRCDRESAYAYGGDKMAKALEKLGATGYFSLFSTHPTTSSRIKKVQNISQKNGTIRPGIINMLSNFLSLVLVVFICTYSWGLTNTPGLYNHYINEVYYPVKYKGDKYKNEIIQIYRKLIPR